MKRDTKSSHMFRDQVNLVTSWFKSWNDCEQTVALYSLLKKVSATQGRFLLQVLQQTMQDRAGTDITHAEHQANSPAYISALCGEPKEAAVSWLLNHLPLLRPGNNEAKAEYLAILPKVLAHSIENSCHIEESRQLLSYSLIHPAITTEERAQFTAWLSALEEQYQLQRALDAEQAAFTHPPPTQPAQRPANAVNGWHAPPPPHPNKHINGMDPAYAAGRAITATAVINHPNMNGVVSSGEHMPLQGTVSAPPYHMHSPAGMPVSNVSDWLNTHHEEMGIPVSGRHINNNNNMIECHAPLSPQSSVTSSGSGSDENHHESANGNGYVPRRNRFLEEGSGMKDVPIWLKSLRLHKYASLFQQLSYDDMLGLNEQKLEQQKVTKGARHKIVLSVNKLRDRQNVLRQMEKEIIESGNLKQALGQIKSMMNTPMKLYAPPKPESDTSGVPGQSGDAPSTPPPNGSTPPNDNKLSSTTPPTGSGNEGDNIAEGDLPGQMTRVLGKACTHLLVTTRLEDECFPLYLQLLDKCIAHEAFTEKQKKLMTSWKQQIQKIWHPPMPKYNLDKQRRAMYSLGFGHTFPMPGSVGQRRPLRGQGPLQVPGIPGQPQWTFGKHPPTLVPPQATPANMAAAAAAAAVFRNNTVNAATYAAAQRPQMFEQMKHSLARTQSAPIKSSQYPGGVSMPQRPVSDRVATEPEINARLDSLCLSMTEHALSDNPDRATAF